MRPNNMPHCHVIDIQLDKHFLPGYLFAFGTPAVRLLISRDSGQKTDFTLLEFNQLLFFLINRIRKRRVLRKR